MDSKDLGEHYSLCQIVDLLMARKFTLSLDEFDIGQMLDGLQVRAQAWHNTAHYLRTGEAPRDFFLCEECSDAHEAQTLAENYDQIIGEVEAQLSAQRP
jgi:hypothetical protein